MTDATQEKKPPILAARIKTARLAKGLSVKQLAKIVGCSARAIHNFESGKIHLSRYFNKLAEVLEIEVGDLDMPRPGRPRRRPDNPGPPSQRIVPAPPGGFHKSISVYTATLLGGVIMARQGIVGTLFEGYVHENGYGLIIASDAMAPAYFSGDTVVVDVELPPYLGAEVVAFNPKTSLMISGILVDHSNGSFVLRFHSPPDGVPREMTLSREEYPQCHPIVMVVRKRPQ
jgi:DNA-binding XRE family transcriptional regulator